MVTIAELGVVPFEAEGGLHKTSNSGSLWKMASVKKMILPWIL